MTTAVVTAAPPSVRLTFEAADLDPDVQTVTVIRTVDGVDTTVRSSVKAFASGGWVGEDHEVPPGVTVSYRAMQWDSGGRELADSAPVEATIPSDGPDVGWISDPLTEGSAIRVVLTDAAGQSPSRPMIGSLLQVGLNTIALVAGMGKLQSLDMSFYSYTEADRKAIFALLGSTGGLVLIRTPPPMLVPRMLYCWAQNAMPQEYSLPAGIQQVRWANTVSEISEPEGLPVTVALSYQVYLDAFPTYLDAQAAYSTYLDAMKNPPGGA